MFSKQDKRAWFRSFPHTGEGALVMADNTVNVKKKEMESSREVMREYLQCLTELWTFNFQFSFFKCFSHKIILLSLPLCHVWNHIRSPQWLIDSTRNWGQDVAGYIITANWDCIPCSWLKTQPMWAIDWGVFFFKHGLAKSRLFLEKAEGPDRWSQLWKFLKVCQFYLKWYLSSIKFIHCIGMHTMYWHIFENICAHINHHTVSLVWNPASQDCKQFYGTYFSSPQQLPLSGPLQTETYSSQFKNAYNV